jgi:hypothetical protein
MARSIPPDAAAMLDLLIDRAPALIAVGVTTLEIEGLSVTLQRPAAAMTALPKAEPVAKQHTDPLRDPSTYPGGRVPGFTREDEQ